MSMSGIFKAVSKFRLALVQLQVSKIKAENLGRAQKLVKEATGQGAKVVVLPECFNSPYGSRFFAEYAEKIPGESTQMLSEAAKECGIYLVGGSIPEEDGGKFYNTCSVFGPDGKLLVKHRKVPVMDWLDPVFGPEDSCDRLQHYSVTLLRKKQLRK